LERIIFLYFIDKNYINIKKIVIKKMVSSTSQLMKTFKFKRKIIYII
jgi:hypothetical protein